MTTSSSAAGEGSLRTAYVNGDKMFWKYLRRQLFKEEFDMSAIQRKTFIKAYVGNLDNRGVDNGKGDVWVY
jgi:hypothetical protein